ncbi:MAG: hypothetical protein ACREBB_09130 [Nitrosotalea sp.]
MVEFKEGAIAVLDVLGVKGVWTRGNTDKIIGDWEAVVQSFKRLEMELKKDSEQKIIPSVQAFSDTIIIVYEGKDPISLLEWMGAHTALPFVRAILKGIYLRGAISMGKFRQTESMIIGPAADEAVEWYESADWMGVMLTPTSSFTMDKLIHEKYESIYFKKYNIPFKDGQRRELWALNWPAYIHTIMKDFILDKRDPKSAILESFSYSPSDPSTFSKYANTMTFFDTSYEERKILPDKSSVNSKP